MNTFAEVNKNDKRPKSVNSFFGRSENSNSFIQPKLTINQPNDPYEQEADAMADKVMGMEKPGIQLKPLPVNSIQRKCEHCEEEEKKMQRKEMSGGETKADNSIENYVGNLNSRGHPLPDEVRSFYEPRFGYDFSNVKVHTDTVAAKSAQSINALAYTSGSNIVFNSGQYAPGTETGKRLLGHELTHIVQQGTNTGILQPMLFRKVGSVNCPPNVAGAPDDPKAALEVIQPLAESLAGQAADELKSDSDIVKGGIPASLSVTFQAYQDNFGLPVARGKGFLNRLTGTVRPTIEIAASEELNILSKRFRFSARFFSQTVGYRCPGTSTITLPGCAAGSCGEAFAFSCRGGGSIALCEPFWQTLATDDARAVALIHESMHIIFGVSGEGNPGEIGETVQSGPGRNFNVAGCYEFIVDALNGAESFPVCPAVPE